MKTKRILRKDEKAVSPVIGVILMVAITVILAAVIAAFVFGMGGTLKKTYTVAATASQTTTDTVIVTYQGGPDADLVRGITVNANGTYGYFNVRPNVGDRVTITDATRITTAKIDPITVIANFTDGTSQVILDTTV
jgi:flagellin-like protein